MCDLVKGGEPGRRARRSFVRGWAQQRQEEMKRASCAVVCTVSLILAFLDLLRFSHGRVEIHTNVFKLYPSRYHLRHPPPPGHPLEKPQQIKEREKEDRLLAAFGQCYYYYIVSLSMRVGDGRRDCLLHDSIAIHARGPQSLSADDVKVE